jgi:integrase/recombinase XerC
LASVQDIFAAWLAKRPRSGRAYHFDMIDFARFLGEPSPGAAVDVLMAGDGAHANRVALAYRLHLESRGLASATVARRLSALRSVVKLGRQLGKIAWTIEIDSPKVEPYRDMRGPGDQGWAAMHEQAKGRAAGSKRTAEAARNLAVLRLLHDLGLRRGEAIGLDLVHVELDWENHGRIWVLRKGKSSRKERTLNPRVREALEAWIMHRGSEPGPLFCRLDNARGDGPLERLSGDSVNRMVRRIGKAAGLGRPVRAHGVRHQAITQALDATQGDIRAVKEFSGHAKYETLELYDDGRKNEAGRITQILGAGD